MRPLRWAYSTNETLAEKGTSTNFRCSLIAPAEASAHRLRPEFESDDEGDDGKRSAGGAEDGSSAEEMRLIHPRKGGQGGKEEYEAYEPAHRRAGGDHFV